MSVSGTPLDALLRGATESERERAWSVFIAEHSRLLLHVARMVVRDHDDAMDAYAHMLEHLRADDFARLRAYAADGRSKFSTWLVVVARRLCLDRQRQRFGRVRDTTSEPAHREQEFRRQLHALAGDDRNLSEIAAGQMAPDEALCAAEIHEALDAALSTLDARDRLLMRLRFEDGLSAAEIARVLGLPSPFHVYRRIDALTEHMRKLLAARGVESPVP